MDSENKKEVGHLHPITILSRQMIKIFLDLGFTYVESPELESEKYNFDTLNFPKDHPARDMQDTFWIKDKPGYILRTHVSNTQVRYLEEMVKRSAGQPLPPIRAVYFGRVFRSEATDATHEAQFYQLECLVVDKASSVANMKGMLEAVFQKLTGEGTKLRIRPSFFPFVEPGFEIDLTCFKCKGLGCTTCKKTGWIEMGGAGMVHPSVLHAGGVDPNEYRGFAFGLGFDRMVMIKYGIEDIRHLYSGDLRFVNQF